MAVPLWAFPYSTSFVLRAPASIIMGFFAIRTKVTETLSPIRHAHINKTYNFYNHDTYNLLIFICMKASLLKPLRTRQYARLVCIWSSILNSCTHIRTTIYKLTIH
jgi:hypothetical protein